VSNRWWRKNRKRRRPWFEDFERMEKMMNKMMLEAFRRSFRSPFTAHKRSVKAHGPHVYGFSISVGPDGKPRIREFGNVRRSRFSPKIRERRKTLVDVLEQDEEVVVVAELPGVDKKDINLQTAEQQLTISVDTPNRKYHEELYLPKEVNPRSAKASYKNGVLEVRFKKLKEKKVKGEKIQV